MSLVTIVAIISFASSTYFIMHAKKLYTILVPYLGSFERKKAEDKDQPRVALTNHVALIGAHRMGQSILKALTQEKEKTVVVDFDPDIIKDLKQKGVTSFFGDISDPYIQEKIQLDKAKLVISTVPDLEDNLMLIENARKMGKKTKIVVMAVADDDATALYKAGANLVIMPHLVGGMHIAKMIKQGTIE